MGLVAFQHFSVLLFLLCCYSIPIAAISIDICESITKTLSADSHGYITSPNYSNDYDPDRTCPLKLVAPEGYFISIHFLAFDLEYCTSCSCDSLTIIDDISFEDSQSTWGANHCGSHLPADNITEENILKLTFVSDHSVSKMGFKMRFTVIPNRNAAPCVQRVTGNSLEAATSKGNITSLNFPYFYPNGVHCFYYLSNQKQGYIRLLFDDFQLEGSEDSCQHYLKIWDSEEADDSSLVGKYCGNHRPPAFQSTGPHVVISFFASNNTNGRGFKLSYEFVTDVRWLNKPYTDCGAYTLNPLGGVLVKRPTLGLTIAMSNSYLYYDCIWVISAPIGERVLIYAQKFPRAAADGSVNFLEIHDGVTSMAPLLTAEYNSWASPIVSDTNQLYIRFKAWFRSTDLLVAIYAAFASTSNGSCHNGFFFCGSSRCIHANLVCDGFDHCHESGIIDGVEDRDEDNCHISTTGTNSGVSDGGSNSTFNEDPSVTDDPGVSADVMYTVSAVSVFSMMFLLVLISAKIWMNKRRQERARTRSFVSTISGNQDTFSGRGSRAEIELASNAAVSVTTHTGPIYINPIFEAPPPYEQIMGPVHGETVRGRRYSFDPPPYSEEDLPVMSNICSMNASNRHPIFAHTNSQNVMDHTVRRHSEMNRREVIPSGYSEMDTEGRLQAAALSMRSLHQLHQRTVDFNRSNNLDQSDAVNNNHTAITENTDEEESVHDCNDKGSTYDSSTLVAFYAKDEEMEDAEERQVQSGTSDENCTGDIYVASDDVLQV
ncbi:uncharacterized protein [Ptychodera flava]